MSYKSSFPSDGLTRQVLLTAGLLLFGTVAATGKEPIQLLFFGDSLTAGYGIDPARAYPALIQRKIDEAGIEAKVQVGAVSGDTSSGGLRRIDWMLRRPVDIFVLALGANDGLRGVEPKTIRENLSEILGRVRKELPDAVLVVAGMRLPPSMGVDYTEAFQAIYPQLARRHDAAFIPYLLEDVGGVVDLNLPDRIHPNPAGHKIVAGNVWEVLHPILKTEQATTAAAKRGDASSGL